MAFRYSRPAMTGAAIFTLAGVTVLPLAQANAAPASPQDEARSGATQGQPNSAAQNGQDQGQQQSANANGQGQQQQAQPGATQGQQGANASGQNQDGATQGGATQDPSQAASGGEQQQGQPGASQDKQGTNASSQGQQAPQSRGASSASQNGQGQPSASQDQQQGANANGQGQQAQGQQQGASASQSSSNSNSASQNNQSRQSQPSAPANQNSGFIAITSVDGFIDPQKTDNSLSVGITGVDNTHRIISDLRVQELDEFGNIVNDDVNTVGGASSNDSEGNLGISVVVDGTKINPNHRYRLYLDVFDQDTLTRSYAYYPVVVWNRSYIPVVPLSAAQ